MPRISFDQITDLDFLGLKKRYKSARNDQVLEQFYTACSIIPISLVLAALFLTLWSITPRTSSMALFQEDIYNWNEERVAWLMQQYEFRF